MAKRIECVKCCKNLGKLEKGSRIRKGTVYLCKECYDKLKTAEFVLNNNRNKSNPLSRFGDMFGFYRNKSNPLSRFGDIFGF